MPEFFRNRWWVVFATVCGLIVGGGAINVFSFAVFLKPITAELGIGRSTFSSALTLHATLAALACPATGWLVDRWGARRIMIPGIVIYALATASYALIQASPFAITLLIFALTGLVGGVGTPIPYAAVITQWFDRQRGLALGIGIAGAGIGVALIPQLVALMIAAFGWRLAYIGLGATILIIAFVPVAIFLREPPEGTAAHDGAAAARRPGADVGAALRSGVFWALAIAFFLDVVAINGTLTHIVALLTDRQIPLQAATAALSGTGAALILGRILSGWCLDRFWGPYVAIGFFILPMIGILVLIGGSSGLASISGFIGAIALGLGIGAEVDLMAFFASRYFGTRNYAKIYGTMFGVFAFGVGIGPSLSGLSFDRFHSYTPVFLLYVAMLAVTCAIFLRLGPYPYPARETAEEADGLKVPA